MLNFTNKSYYSIIHTYAISDNTKTNDFSLKMEGVRENLSTDHRLHGFEPSRMNGGAHDQQVDAEQPQNRSENRRESLEERRRKAAEGMEGGEVIDGIPADFGPYSRRHVRPEDILWWLCLFFTFAYFDLPAVLICHNQIDRQFLKMAFVCAICLPFLLFTYPLAKMPNRTHAPALFRVFQLLSIFCFFGNAFFFCLATWKVFGVWAVFIAGVTSMSFLAIIAVV